MIACRTCGHSNAEHARFCERCGAAQQEPSDALIGQVIAGRYRITRVIGEGGMGRVYLAEQRMGTALRSVAIKVLSASVHDQVAVTRFYRECETVVQLTHPNTIRFYDFGPLDVELPGGGRDNRLYIAMEFVDGRSLSAAIAQGPMPVGEVERLVRQIGGALTEAHRRGIVHRDLKPDNVLLARSDEGEIPKVCDFGIAKREVEPGRSSEITAQGTIIGTPAYMSPEQITGNPVDERSDVYALALMTYEMLTGSRPFVARTPLEWATAHLTEEPRSFDHFEATRGLPLSHRDAILRALAKQPERRTATVRQFVDELCGASGSGARGVADTRGSGSQNTPLAHDRTVGDTPATLPRPSWAPRLAGAAAVALFFAGGVGLLWTMSSGADRADDPEVIAEVADAGADAGSGEEWLGILQYEDRAEHGAFALGPPDGRCARLGPRGTITLELTPGVRIATTGDDQPDLRVLVIDEVIDGETRRSGPYRVDVGVERHRYTTIAEGLIASMPLDVDQYDIARFRYVRIKNREQRGTVCVDAVAAFAADESRDAARAR